MTEQKYFLRSFSWKLHSKVIAEPLGRNVVHGAAYRFELSSDKSSKPVHKRFVCARGLHVHHLLEKLKRAGRFLLQVR
jgi:hypothetical protein